MILFFFRFHYFSHEQQKTKTILFFFYMKKKIPKWDDVKNQIQRDPYPPLHSVHATRDNDIRPDTLRNNDHDPNGNSVCTDIDEKMQIDQANIHEDFRMKTSNVFMNASSSSQESLIDDKCIYDRQYSTTDHNNVIRTTKVDSYDSPMQILSSPESILSFKEEQAINQLAPNRIQQSRKNNRNNMFSHYFPTNQKKAKISIRRVTFEGGPPDLSLDSESTTNSMGTTEQTGTERHHRQEMFDKGISCIVSQSKVNAIDAADLSSDMVTNSMHSINDEKSQIDQKSQVKIVPTIRGEAIIPSPICTLVESPFDDRTNVKTALCDNSSSHNDKSVACGDGMLSRSENLSRHFVELLPGSSTIPNSLDSSLQMKVRRISIRSLVLFWYYFSHAKHVPFSSRRILSGMM